MIKQIVFIEDKDIDYISSLTQWANENNISCFCFPDAKSLIKNIHKFKNVNTLFIIDYFLPNIQGNDLIQFLLSVGINSKNIILTSIVKKPLIYLANYFNLLGFIYKTGPNMFVESIKGYLNFKVEQFRVTQIFLNEKFILNKEFGYILSVDGNIFIKLTKKEKDLFNNMIIVSVGMILGKFLANNISVSTIWRLNKKLVRMGFKILKSENAYILIKL